MYTRLVQSRLGVTIEKEDEMHCLVSGANFLLKVSKDLSLFNIIFTLVSAYVDVPLLLALYKTET